MKYFLLIIAITLFSGCHTWQQWQVKWKKAKLETIKAENKIKAEQEKAAREKKKKDAISKDETYKERGKDKPVAGGGDGAKKTSVILEDVFTWGAVILFPLSLILLVLSVKFNKLFKIGAYVGLAGLACMVGVYSIPWIWYPVAVLFWGGLICLVIFIIRTFQKHKDNDHIIEELGKHFDDPEGHEKISEEARKAYLPHRYKGDIHNWKKVRTEDKVKENNNLKEGYQ